MDVSLQGNYFRNARLLCLAFSAQRPAISFILAPNKELACIYFLYGERAATGRTGTNSRGQVVIHSNIETIPGKQIVQFYGVVSGSTVRAKHIGRDLMASLKNIVGGELKGYTELLQEARNDALVRMTEQAESLGGYGLHCSTCS